MELTREQRAWVRRRAAEELRAEALRLLDYGYPLDSFAGEAGDPEAPQHGSLGECLRWHEQARAAGAPSRLYVVVEIDCVGDYTVEDDGQAMVEDLNSDRAQIAALGGEAT